MVDMAQCEDDVLANLGFEEVTGISLETATNEAQGCEDRDERIVMPRLSQQQEEFIASLSEKRRRQYEKLRQRLARVAAIERSIAELRLKKKLMVRVGNSSFWHGAHSCAEHLWAASSEGSDEGWSYDVQVERRAEAVTVSMSQTL